MAGVVGALAAQLVLAVLFIWGLAVRDDPDIGEERLDAITVFELPPPPEPPQSSESSAEAPAPSGVTGEAVPIEAPHPPVVIAPSPASSVAGEGTETAGGAGAEGSGPGAGGVGSGGGDGGVAKPARKIAGELRDSDYPRDAARQGLAGTVAISFRVRADGLVDRCTVLRSSGHALLDDLTCRLFVRRYRFRPATDAAGRPVESTLQTTFTWSTRRR